MKLLRLIRQIFIAIYAILNLTLLIFVGGSEEFPQPSSTAASALTLLTSLFVMAVSWTEHGRSLRTSFLLNGYLFISGLFDIAQCRTLFLRRDPFPIPHIFAIALGVKRLFFSWKRNRNGIWKQQEAGVQKSAAVFSVYARSPGLLPSLPGETKPFSAWKTSPRWSLHSPLRINNFVSKRPGVARRGMVELVYSLL